MTCKSEDISSSPRIHVKSEKKTALSPHKRQHLLQRNYGRPESLPAEPSHLLAILLFELWFGFA